MEYVLTEARINELIPSVVHDPDKDNHFVDVEQCETQTEKLRKAVDLVEDLLQDRCGTCKVINPQHKDCTSCDDMDNFRGRFSEILGIPYSEIKDLKEQIKSFKGDQNEV